MTAMDTKWVINAYPFGGTHSPTSRHFHKKAVDINRVNGQSPFSESGKQSFGKLQRAFADEPNIRENFGPEINEKTVGAGTNTRTIQRDDQVKAHENHIDASGQR